MKKYCPNCGSANEYTGIAPDKCQNCKKPLNSNFLVPPTIVTPNNKKTAIADEDDDNDGFDTYMEEPPEKITQREIEQIFLTNASRGIKLEDFIKQQEPRNIEEPKKTSSRRRKK